MNKLIDCRYVYREQFDMLLGYQPKNSLLFITEGKIRLRINGTGDEITENTLLYFPDNVYFERKMLTPCTFYYVRFEESTEYALPAGKIEIKDKVRLTSTLKLLLQLNGTLGNDRLKNAFLDDIFNQIEAETLCTGVKKDRVVSSVHDYFEKYIDKKITLDDAAAHADMSASGLIHRFKSCVGMTPIDYLISLRIQKAEELLCCSENSIAEISEKCGFDNPYYFSNVFKKHRGMSPSEFRKKSRI